MSATVPERPHEYDGIRELDNRLPNWWLGILWVTIVFSYGYWVYYHVLAAGPDPLLAYREPERVEPAAVVVENTEENLLKLASDPDAVAQGKRFFAAHCLSCHGADGQGLVGPNLTDKAWIHGGKALDVWKSIASGYPQKQMPAWEPVIGPAKVQKVAAFVLAQRGKNLPGRPPEGSLE